MPDFQRLGTLRLPKTPLSLHLRPLSRLCCLVFPAISHVARFMSRPTADIKIEITFMIRCDAVHAHVLPLLFFLEGDETEISHFLEDPTSVPIDKKASFMGTFKISMNELSADVSSRLSATN